MYNVSNVSEPVRTGTVTLWWAGSYSEALNNPRLFTFYKEKNLLFLPVSLYTPYSSKDLYRYKDVFQGVVQVSVTPQGVFELWRVSSLNISDETLRELRNKECKAYVVKEEKVCHKLIWGGEVCEAPSEYVPSYCYLDSSLGEYKANTLWNYSNEFIDRVVYVKDRLFTFSPIQVQSLQIPSLTVNGTGSFH